METTKTFSAFREPTLPYRRFSFPFFLELLESKVSQGNFELQIIGHSVEERPIHSVQFGYGPIKVLLWTQMHGNESTATRAFFDLLNYFIKNENNEEVKTMLSQISIVFIPVLNPDGMVRFQRVNAVGIDPNRDARSQQTPEIRALIDFAEKWKPDWCFNLHDQRNLFNVKGSFKPATISFLSPSTQHGDCENGQEAKELIDVLRTELEEMIPAQIARFNDEYYPRAIGEYFQEKGFRTILVESGGAVNDPEREISRSMNFSLLKSAFEKIADHSWKNGQVASYYSIPENDQKMVDLLVKRVSLNQNGHSIVMDIGIERVEVKADNHEGFVYQSIIKELGDLRESFGYEVLDAAGYSLDYPLELNGPADFRLSCSGKEELVIKNGFIL